MRHKTILQDGEHRGFRRAMNAVPLGQQTKLRKELQKAIGGTPSKVCYYINGSTIIRVEMTAKLTKIFNRYGIESDKIFDE